jgi:serine protease Do
MPHHCPLPSLRLCLAHLMLASLVAGSGLYATAARATELRNTAIVKAVQSAKPSIVNIHGRKTIRNETASFGTADEFRQVNGMGTGVVIDERGYIVTNNHVVEGVGRIRVTLPTQEEYIAKLIAHDPSTDLAVIKINPEKPLRVITIGASHDLMPGEPVVAVGNAFGYENTVTRGIISALHRSVQVSDEQKYHNLIQTDASINPGNSGGPLLNIDGEMIGINVAVRVGAQGIGFAIPVDDAMEVAARLLSAERLENVRHGVVGESVGYGAQRKFVIRSIRRGSAAEAAGLKPGDTIREAGGYAIRWAVDLERAMIERQAGDSVEFTVDRDGTSENLQLAVVKGVSSPAGGQLADRIWESLGLRVGPMDSQAFNRLGSRYRGGLEVKEVRPAGPAASQGMQPGDVLVGMHVWETVSLDNLAYILNRTDFDQLSPMKFYILRGQDTLYGHLRVANKGQ